MKREDVTIELDSFNQMLEEYEEELKDLERRSLELKQEKENQEKINDDYILKDKEKVNINKVVRLKDEIESLEEYKRIYKKAMEKKLNEKAVRVVEEYNDKARKYMTDISTTNRERLEKLKEEYKEKKAALKIEIREKEDAERIRVVEPRKKVVKYLDEEQGKDARLLELGY